MKANINSIARAIFVVVCVAFLPASLGAQAQSTNTTKQDQDWSRYMDPGELFTRLNRGSDVQVIDIRNKKFHKKGIIPGAVWIPFADWRGPEARRGKPPEATELSEMLGQAGLDLGKPIVVHNQSGRTIQTGRSAIVYWILKSAGANEIAVLNGGYKAWAAAGLPYVDAHKQPQPTSVKVTYRYDWWADPIDILAISSKQKEGAILDARLDAQVKKSIDTGKPMMSIPFARYTPAAFFLDQLSEKKTASEGQQVFREELEARGIILDEGMLISVCQTGELSAISWFYASEIVGIGNVRYYPDALQGWKSDGGLMFGLKNPGSSG